VPDVDADASAPILERIAILRAALEDLETELSVGPAAEREAEGASPP
jgi:hypothetical protein